ncbi:hypothetical protein [Ascidiimonas aurantiaca]|uniref:hypothetical protein n=1 Tax=Ascidiimonas aurantiaca TaxID=1685432 RepID=UPI0030EE219B
MKKNIILLALTGVILNTNAQNNKIESTGNVGIGTTSPTSTLDVHTTDHNSASGVVISQGNQSNNRNSGRLFFENLGEENNSFTIMKEGDRLSFKGNSQAGVSSGTEYFNIKNNGSIGIGTPNAEHGKLHVNGNGPDQGINLWTKSGETTSRIWINNQEKTFHLSKGNNPVNGITISDNGLVGIGTTTPDMKLTVKGKIHTEEVKVDLNVPAPDYVFKENYPLRSIEEVETFIKENSHLPEIPSAKEFEENGVMLAQMNMDLLKKIEELTLYTIQQEKKLTSQNKEIEKLKKENKELRSLVERVTQIEKLLALKK